MIGWENSRHFLKPIVTWSHEFSRAWRRLHVFASNSDWFTALFVSPMIGQSNYNLGVGFAKVNLNFSNSRKTK